MRVATLFNRYYMPAYEKAEQLLNAGAISVDEFVERTAAADVKARARVKKETGYVDPVYEEHVRRMKEENKQ